ARSFLPFAGAGERRERPTRHRRGFEGAAAHGKMRETGRIDMGRFRASICIGFAALLAIGAGAPARAQSGDAAKYPDQLVRLVVPFSAGSMTDILARAVADKLSETWKQQVIVENRPGLGSTTGIAAELLKQTTNTDIVHLPFRGLPESQTAIIRGDAAMGFTFFNVGGDLIQSGKMRGLAITGARRLPGLPDVPTFKEA